jgi:hypothetical protein
MVFKPEFQSVFELTNRVPCDADHGQPVTARKQETKPAGDS